MKCTFGSKQLQQPWKKEKENQTNKKNKKEGERGTKINYKDELDNNDKTGSMAKKYVTENRETTGYGIKHLDKVINSGCGDWFQVPDHFTGCFSSWSSLHRGPVERLWYCCCSTSPDSHRPYPRWENAFSHHQAEHRGLWECSACRCASTGWAPTSASFFRTLQPDAGIPLDCKSPSSSGGRGNTFPGLARSSRFRCRLQDLHSLDSNRASSDSADGISGPTLNEHQRGCGTGDPWWAVPPRHRAGCSSPQQRWRQRCCCPGWTRWPTPQCCPGTWFMN